MLCLYLFDCVTERRMLRSSGHRHKEIGFLGFPLQHHLRYNTPEPPPLPGHCLPLPFQECTLRHLHHCHRHSCGPRPVWRSRRLLCKDCLRLCTGSLASRVSPGIPEVCLHQVMPEIRDPDLHTTEPRKALFPPNLTSMTLAH